MTLAALAVGLYVLLLSAVGLYGHRFAASSDMFNLFGRRAGVARAAAGYLSLIGAGELVTIAQLGYDAGWSLLWFPGGISVGFLALAIGADRVRLAAAAAGATTLVGYVRATHGSAASFGLYVVYLFSLGSLLIIQFMVGGQLLSLVAGIPTQASAVVMAVVICSYLVVGGYVAVLSTDVLRLLFLAVGLVVLVMSARGSSPTVAIEATPLSLLDAAVLFVLGFFGALCAGDVWQTIFASRSRGTMAASLVLSAAAFLIFGALVGMLGMATKTVVPELAQGGTALIAAAQSTVPANLSPLLALLIVGSVMATADTEIWVISASTANLIKSNDLTQGASSQLKTLTRSAIPIVTFSALLLAYLGQNAQNFYESLLLVLTAIAPAVVSIMLAKSSHMFVAVAIWTGLFCSALLLTYYSFAVPPNLTVLPAIVALITTLIAAAFERFYRKPD